MTGAKRKFATAWLAGAMAVSMIGAAYAAVPLYRLFCQVTGFGGTTGVAAAAPSEIGERIIVVEFDANTARDMPWEFRPEQRRIEVFLGQEGLAFYRATNPSPDPVVGRAVFNVTPLKAGQYFRKIQCFCFDEQTLEPGQTVDMGVTFFVDPALADDPEMWDVERITLSYTFFLVDDAGELSLAEAGDTDAATLAAVN